MAQEQTTELLPCPWCGKQPVYHEYQWHNGQWDRAYRCVNPNCGVSVETRYRRTPEESAKLWNTRTPSEDNHA